MFNFSGYQISLDINPLFIAIALPAAALFSWYIYKYTIPKTSTFKKYLLITARTLVLVLILLLIFDPSVTKINRDEQKALIPVFIDNSSSIAAESDTTVLLNFVSELQNNDEVNFELNTFGGDVKRLQTESNKKISFDEPVTNFENIFTDLDNSDGFIASALIISDGILNDGKSSVYQSEKVNFPIYTVGIGDTSRTIDAAVSSILTNRFLYKDSETIIVAEISNQNLAGESADITLLENNRVIQTEQIELSESGINRVVFSYLPTTAGKQKITLRVNKIAEEKNIDNNIRSKFVDVIENKLNILVAAASPSADFRAIYAALSEFDEYDVNRFVLVNENTSIGENFTNKLDSAQVLVLLNFVPGNIPGQYWESLIRAIDDKNLPHITILGVEIESNYFNQIEPILPVTSNRNFNEVYLAQLSIKPNSLGIIDEDEIENFNDNDLPPVHYINNGYQLKPGSNLLAVAKVNNIDTDFPMIAARSEAGKRAITILANNIWRWRITPVESNRYFFRNLVKNSIQWLRVSSDRRTFFVETNKDVYAAGETVKFSAELYDDKLEPIDDGNITINIQSPTESYNVQLNPEGNGLYKGELKIPGSGDVIYTAEADQNGVQVNSFNGRFNIGEIDLEKLQTVMQDNYLKLLSSNTGGKFSYITNASVLIDEITNRFKDAKKVRTSSITYNLLSSELILLLIILILSVEWFVRKREGML